MAKMLASAMELFPLRLNCCLTVKSSSSVDLELLRPVLYSETGPVFRYLGANFDFLKCGCSTLCESLAALRHNQFEITIFFSILLCLNLCLTFFFLVHASELMAQYYINTF